MHTSIKLPLCLTILLSTTSYTAAANTKSLHGEYNVVKGEVKTYNITEQKIFAIPEQLGTYKIVLKHADWNGLSDSDKAITHRKLSLRGILKGKINPFNFTAEHVLTDLNRSYVLRTDNDVMVIESGDLFCSTGMPMVIKEYVNLVQGEGVYSNLISGTIALHGVIDNCPFSATYGQNDLTVIPEESSVVLE